MLQGYVATIKVLVKADDSGQAEDYVADTFRNLKSSGLVDWSYLPEGEGFSSPSPVEIPADYEEGDLLNY